ncbi:MAG: DUF3667 domain-containing protein [Salinimicrobium sp.]
MDQDKKLKPEGKLTVFPKIKKERHELKYRSTVCLNCQHPLDISDEFCPNCGQLNSTKKLAFNDFFNEFFAGILSYDSRFYRTLGVLLFKPGKISKDYIEGKRVRYANPYRFYLSASIIFFLLWNFPQDFNNLNTPTIGPQSQEEKAEMDSVITAERVNNAEFDSLLKNNTLAANLVEKSLTRDTVKTKKDVYLPEAQLDTMSFFERLGKKGIIFFDHYETTKMENPDVALDSLKYENTPLNHWIYKKTVDIHIFLNNPGLFLSYFVSKLPFIIFFYLPVFALFIWLLYLRRPFTYMEHLIFTFHNQTTWFVVFGAAILLDWIFQTEWIQGFSMLVFLFYLYKAFRRFYGQGRVKTILKFIIINIIFFTLAIVATFFSLLASFAIY